MSISSIAISNPMTSDEFLVWAEGQSDEKFELHEGVVVAMSRERRLHGLVKRNALVALLGVKPPCAAYVDGIAIKVSETTTYIPDVLVDCGDQSDMGEMTAVEPVIVVEVLSDSTSKADTGAKLEGYFTVPSVQHYLLVDGADRRVTYHRRETGGLFTQILHTGTLTLDPPDMTVLIDDFWKGLPDDEEAA